MNAPLRRAGTITGVIVVVAFLVGAAVVLARGPGTTGSALVGRPAPEVTLAAVDGSGERALTDAGAITFVNFMAAWCVPCLKEHVDLNDLVTTWPGGGALPTDVAIVSVAFQTDLLAVDRFLDRVGRSVPTLFDPDGRAAIEFGVVGVPETFVIDATGMVRGRIVGPVRPDQVVEIVDRLRAGDDIDDLV